MPLRRPARLCAAVPLRHRKETVAGDQVPCHLLFRLLVDSDERRRLVGEHPVFRPGLEAARVWRKERKRKRARRCGSDGTCGVLRRSTLACKLMPRKKRYYGGARREQEGLTENRITSIRSLNTKINNLRSIHRS